MLEHWPGRNMPQGSSIFVSKRAEASATNEHQRMQFMLKHKEEAKIDTVIRARIVIIIVKRILDFFRCNGHDDNWFGAEGKAKKKKRRRDRGGFIPQN